MKNDIVYVLPTGGYDRWTSDERTSVEQFLRDHDIDPADVSVNRSGGNEIVVHLLADGSMELSVWAMDRQDGKAILCPHCPGCARQHKVKVPLRTAVPAHPAAHIASAVTVEP